MSVKSMKKVFAILALLYASLASATTYIPTSLLAGSVAIVNGGTGAATQAGALANLGGLSSAAAASTYATLGANSNITSMSGTMQSASAAPSSVCNPSAGYSTAFSCDLSKLNYVNGTSITGTATLGEPTTAYAITPNLAGTYQFYDNNSGWNSGTTTAGPGRTGAMANYTMIVSDTASQGDTAAYFVSGVVKGAKPGASGNLGFLANPAAEMYSGQLIGLSAGAYMELFGDANCSDNGNDDACIGVVINMNRTVNTAALGETWIGDRQQSVGTKNIDAFFSGSGPSQIGLDLSGMTGGNLGIALPRGAGIYGNVTNSGSFPIAGTIIPGNDEIVDTSGGWQFIYGGVDSLAVSASNVISGVPLNLTATGTALAVTNNATIGGTLSASGNDALMYQNSSGQSIPNSTATTVTTWTKVADRVNANFTASTGTFTAPANGYYHVSAQLLYSANTGTLNAVFGAYVVANGVTVAQGMTSREAAASSYSDSASVDCVVSLTTGQTIVLQAFQNSGSAVALNTTAAFNYLSINRIP
jgi:hypothetical protein